MSDGLSNVLSVVVLTAMGVRLVQAANISRSRRGRTLSREIWTRIGWRHVWPVPFVLTVVLAVAIPLVQVPPLSWGWWSVLGGNGNPVFGLSSTTNGTVWSWLIPLVFISLVLVALPLFTNAEERMFRTGAEHWSNGRRAVKVVQFGLIHVVIGIPIAVALALSVSGAYFMSVYLRAYRRTTSAHEATLESTRAHTAYNALIIVTVLIAIAADALI